MNGNTKESKTKYIHCANKECAIPLIPISSLNPIDDYSRVERLLGGIVIKQGWQVKDIFDFDSVALSKPHPSQPGSPISESLEHLDTQNCTKEEHELEPTHSNKTLPKLIRFLCCGECDKGPIGYAIIDGDIENHIIVVDQNRVA